MNNSAPNLTVRVGCHIVYETANPTAILLVLKPRHNGTQSVLQQELSFTPHLPCYHFEDAHGNLTDRAVLQPGENIIHHDALVSVPSLPDNPEPTGLPVPVYQLPPETLRYTLPSRYCDSDKLLDFAWRQFGHWLNGYDRVQAICDWVHNNIEYRFGSGSPELSAFDVFQRRHGVCRDFAHLVVALCRALNLPARYVTGHLPDIGFIDPGSPMDFHAYAEVYLGGKWWTYDARFNVPRIGRIKVSCGYDAVDCAFATVFGPAQMTAFDVWAYQVAPGTVTIGEEIDLSKRLDGTLEVRGLQAG